MLDANSFLQSLRQKESSENEESNSQQEKGFVKSDLPEADYKPKEKNPYSQKELQKFIQYAGFEIDPIPNFTEIANRLNNYKREEPEVIEVKPLDKHEEIEDISPLKKNAKREADIQREAIRKLIAKYKG